MNYPPVPEIVPQVGGIFIQNIAETKPSSTLKLFVALERDKSNQRGRRVGLYAVNCAILGEITEETGAGGTQAWVG